MKYWICVGVFAVAAAMFGGTTGRIGEAQAVIVGGGAQCNQKTCSLTPGDFTCTGPANVTKTCITVNQLVQSPSGAWYGVPVKCKVKTCL